ncbi:MAG: ATP-dependent Clp protease adaptor ClpS [Desulfuromonas sp.]|nr:MAG: ATP-dependent Clp protease adaptor ClpS [Desulfuromonas sp.]
MGQNGNQNGNNSKVQVKTVEKVSMPSLFKVLMHNDDYTTMEFVVEVLQDIFGKSHTEAEKIMLTIHFQGVGHCGTFPYSIAETKAEQTRMKARKAGFPLRCSLEEA